MGSIPEGESGDAVSGLQAYVQQRLASGERQILLMTHLVVGYPSLDANRTMLKIMATNDVDLVELQMPFSEPVADGPIFVRANQEALAAGLRVDDYFEFFSEAGELCSFPRLFMGYYNTAFRLGHQTFCTRLAKAGAAGYILPDLPWEEYGDLGVTSERHQLESILLMTPTNTAERLQGLGARARGFVYAVARKGVTGEVTEFEADLYEFLDRCRGATDLPLALGFGLRDGEDLRKLHGRVEIGIVGSALLSAWEEGGERAYGALIESLATAR